VKKPRKVERVLERFAIKNLTLYLVGGQGIALLLSLGTPGFVQAMLLVPEAVMDGEWWRVLSFILTPPFGNPILAVFALYLLYFMGGSLESQWGTLRYNLYVLVGFVMTIAAAFLFPFAPATNAYVTGSIFLAFAYLYPEFELLLFFVLPVKIKWLAWITWAGYGYGLVVGGWPTRALILVAIANFLLFFGRDLFYKARYGHRRMTKQTTKLVTRDKPTHVCAVCGITDKSDKTTEFRYCTKCDPPVAYCMAHLQDHPHRTGGA
jgi:ribosomal protein L37AE/L43A